MTDRTFTSRDSHGASLSDDSGDETDISSIPGFMARTSAPAGSEQDAGRDQRRGPLSSYEDNPDLPKDLMTIREMSDAFEVTPRTLRFYEAKELLFPIRDGQKRLFTRRDRGRLKLILRGKRFGFRLEEIRQLLELYHMGDQQLTQLSRTCRIAEDRLEDMERQRDELDRTINDLKEQLAWGQGMIATLKAQQADEEDRDENAA